MRSVAPHRTAGAKEATFNQRRFAAPFIGDGLLAIFPIEHPGVAGMAARNALAAATQAPVLRRIWPAKTFGPPDRGGFALALLCFTWRGTVLCPNEWETT
jgi:hypothetical protein